MVKKKKKKKKKKKNDFEATLNPVYDGKEAVENSYPSNTYTQWSFCVLRS